MRAYLDLAELLISELHPQRLEALGSGKSVSPERILAYLAEESVAEADSQLHEELLCTFLLFDDYRAHLSTLLDYFEANGIIDNVVYYQIMAAMGFTNYELLYKRGCPLQLEFTQTGASCGKQFANAAPVDLFHWDGISNNAFLQLLLFAYQMRQYRPVSSFEFRVVAEFTYQILFSVGRENFGWLNRKPLVQGLQFLLAIGEDPNIMGHAGLESLPLALALDDYFDTTDPHKDSELTRFIITILVEHGADVDYACSGGKDFLNLIPPSDRFMWDLLLEGAVFPSVNR